MSQHASIEHLGMPEHNDLDRRKQRAVPKAGVGVCICGNEPVGVEYVSDVFDDLGQPVPEGSCVVIECPCCGNKTIGETVTQAALGWENLCGRILRNGHILGPACAANAGNEVLAKKFLSATLKTSDVYTHMPNLRSDSGWGFGIEKLLGLIGLRILSSKAGPRNNCSDGERHAIFYVGLDGAATHEVDATWNDYSWTVDQVKILCGEHDCWQIKIKQKAQFNV